MQGKNKRKSWELHIHMHIISYGYLHTVHKQWINFRNISELGMVL